MDPEAQFWQTKYFELLGHTSTVMARLARPQLREAMQQQADALRSQGGTGDQVG